MPGTPQITAVTAGDTQITVAVTADQETDVIYARYRVGKALPGNAWAAESETFKRTGSGDIVITGLTNGTGYRIGAYAKSGTETSDWDVAFQTPSDGDLAADSMESLPLFYLMATISASATFQSVVGAANATEALDSIKEIRHESAWSLPDVIVALAEGMDIPGLGDGLTKGSLTMEFRAAIDSSHDEGEAFNVFMNWTGNTIKEMREKAGNPGYLDIVNIKPFGSSPQRPDSKNKKVIRDPEGNIIDDHYRRKYTVEYRDV